MFTPRGPMMIKGALRAPNHRDRCSPILKKSTGTSTSIVTVSQSPLAFPYCEFTSFTSFLCLFVDLID